MPDAGGKARDMEQPAKTVLIVDDELEIREFLRFIFEREGYAVLEAADGCQGLEQCRNSGVDVLVTDLVMPEKEGIETIIGALELNPKLKVIAMSGVINGDTYLEIAVSLGAHATLRKPFSRAQVLAALSRVTASGAGQQH